MKCHSCNFEIAETQTSCSKCGTEISEVPPWFPGWGWHIKTLGIIYAALIIIFIVLKVGLASLNPPYNIRKINPEATPWLTGRPANDSLAVSDGNKTEVHP